MLKRAEIIMEKWITIHVSSKSNTDSSKKIRRRRRQTRLRCDHPHSVLVNFLPLLHQMEQTTSLLHLTWVYTHSRFSSRVIVVVRWQCERITAITHRCIYLDCAMHQGEIIVTIRFIPATHRVNHLILFCKTHICLHSLVQMLVRKIIMTTYI